MIIDLRNRILLFILPLNLTFVFTQDYSPKSSGEVVKYNYYSLSYNEYHEQANWVYYKLNNLMLLGTTKRTNNFRTDYNISSKSSSPSDYRGSGYDRGHLAPAGDMKINSRAMSESFLMSNISPQNPSSNSYRKIGKSKISVPTQFYKVIFIPSENKMIAFLMPNQKIENSLKNYVVSVDHIEEITGIDFHHKLEDELEGKLESISNIEKWDFNLIYN